MLVEHGGSQPGTVVTGWPARRPLPLLVVTLAAAIALQSAGVIVLGLTSPPVSLVLGLTAMAAFALFVTVARAIAATTITIADGGVMARTWFGTRIFGWDEIEDVVVEPVSGRFTDPRASAEPDVGLSLRRRSPSGAKSEPVLLLVQPAGQSDALSKLAVRILRSRRAAFGERVVADFATRGGGRGV